MFRLGAAGSRGGARRCWVVDSDMMIVWFGFYFRDMVVR